MTYAQFMHDYEGDERPDDETPKLTIIDESSPVTAEMLDIVHAHALKTRIDQLRTSMRLLNESLDSYEKSGDRALDKVEVDLKIVSDRCWNVATRIRVRP